MAYRESHAVANKVHHLPNQSSSADLARLALSMAALAAASTFVPAPVAAQAGRGGTAASDTSGAPPDTAVSAAAAAAAGTAMEASSGDAEARALFESGRTAYAEAQYADALEDFQRAYALSDRPELLYNMAQCFDRLRRDTDAIDALERYLAALPDAANRTEVEARLEALRAAVRDREWAAAAWVAPTEPTTVEVGIETQWWFWTLIGVGVVGAGVGIGVGVAFSGETVAPAVTGDVGPGGVVAALVTF